MIAPHILLLSAFLSVTWGVYLAYTIMDYRRVRTSVATRRVDDALLPARRRGDTVAAFRRMLVAICVWSLPFSFMFRTFCVLVGIGDEIAAQVTFFALVGPNVVCSIFAVVSLKYD